jgi:magnesium chelatase family protein
VRERVVAARERQAVRLGSAGVASNAELDAPTTRTLAALDGRSAKPLVAALDAGMLTGRGHDRVLRVARTIADLAGHDRVRRDDVAEALGYRAAAAGTGRAAA